MKPGDLSCQASGIVTDEHLRVHETLLGRALATPLRRGVAMVVDLTICIVLGVPWLLLVASVGTHLNAPRLLPMVWQARSLSEEEALSSPLLREISLELMRLAAKRRPEAVPREVLETLESGDQDQQNALLSSYRVNLLITLDGQPSYFQADEGIIHLRGDVLFGRLAPVFGWATFALMYFTLVTWRLRGRTIGKLVARIRVVQLDGRPMTLWQCFSRAGGYAASLSTFGLGFLESLWHPNRQTVHDRVSGTVVVRE